MKKTGFGRYRPAKRHHKNYKDIIGSVNRAIERAAAKKQYAIVYIRHNLSLPQVLAFKGGHKGAEVDAGA